MTNITIDIIEILEVAPPFLEEEVIFSPAEGVFCKLMDDIWNGIFD